MVCIALAGTTFGRQSGSVQTGSIQGTVMDADFEAPLPGARIEVVETRQSAESDNRGSFVVREVPPGSYTVVIRKGGYTAEVLTVTVTAGGLADADASLAGEFTDLEEFVVEEIALVGGASEAGLLNLRFEAPSLVDSIGSDLIRRATVGDAGEALKLVSGATVADDSTAVVRGLPDRYISSQVNGVRLPSANEDKRAVELDQFPSAVIESVQVSKTFTPDQQGDASGGAVNVVLKSVPDAPVFSFSGQSSYNTQVTNEQSFLSYRGGGVGAFGREAGDRGVQFDNIGGNWTGAVGVSEAGAPRDYKFSSALGGSRELENGWKVGGFLSLFYEKDSSFYRNGRNDSFWQDTPGGPLVPQIRGAGSVSDGDFQTALFDVTQGSQFVQWGTSASVGLETDHHGISLSYLYSHTAEDVATLAEDTRGKEFFFPGYDPNDPAGPGNIGSDTDTAPYIRTETLEYTERTTGTLQLAGKHEFDVDPLQLGSFTFDNPKLDWIVATSFADLDQPDKRLFGGIYRPVASIPATPTSAFRPGSTTPSGRRSARPRTSTSATSSASTRPSRRRASRAP